jgi:hypothetical protein
MYAGDVMNEQPSVPLDHRTRRRMLRRLHEVGGSSTAAELSTDLKLKLTEIWYHARVLAKYRQVKEGLRGVDRADTRYESMVIDDPDVTVLLISTEAEDEPQ